MQRFVKGSRIFVIFAVTAIVLTVYTAFLYKIQIFDTAGLNRDMPSNTVTTGVTVAAARGDILDRNGQVLVSSVPSYNIILSRDEILARDNTNEEILKMAQTVNEYGGKYTDTFPITVSAPFAYVDMTDSQKSRLSSYLEYFGLDENISATDLIIWMKDHYNVDFTSALPDTRKIIGIRYELECRVIMNIDTYVFVEDASQELISVLRERGVPGIYVDTAYTRVYNTKYAAHLLGYIGMMTAEEYEYYGDLGYPMNCKVGKDGVEAAFEEYLHGKDGYKTITTTPDGTVVNENTVTPAKAGNNVYLTLDIGLQKVAEDSLEARITSLNKERKENEKVTGGAVVVKRVNSGQTLVSASYPTYDPSTMLKDYDLLLKADNDPLFNRATMGLYNPGSTFKMSTALAGLRHGTVTPDTYIYDSGIYDVYSNEGFEMKCWIYGETGAGHGYLNLVEAIENSCNYYFCYVGDNTGIDGITQAAEDFGLGSPTGLEVYEETGTVASPETKEKAMDEQWYAADTLLASIGQGMNYYTPVQLANYVSTIASGGTRYKMTLLDKVVSSDYSNTIMASAPVVEKKLTGVDTGYLTYIQQGMRAVASYGSASTVFGDYSIPIAAKTGTTQSDTSESNSGVFVCYAPADDPEIAISVVVEKGKSGSTVMTIAADIINAYFNTQEPVEAYVAYEGDLMR
ncbi:MAG: hypothetical protein IJ072_08235 [Oscillospiraceae bacterium]|nr:hypothetical protein [Oscillospiraceae bacterium]